MKHKQNKSFRRTYILSVLPILGIAIIAGVASSFPGTSRAADSFKNAPVGFADYCRLEGATTVIYGWAHDSQAGATSNPWVNVIVAGQTVRVATNIDNYRENWINNYLQNNNYKTASKYGFKASFIGIYKGSAPTITGRIENVDAGSNQNLQINTNTPISSGPPDKYYFGGNRVPDTCLPAAPVVSNPNTTPSTPTSTTPSTSTATAPAATNSTSKTTTPKPSTTPASTQSNTPQAASTESISYTLTVRLVDGEEVLPDIAVALRESDQEIVTDSEGTAIFTNLDQNQYTATFTIDDVSYEYVLTITETDAKTGSVNQTVNIADIEPLPQTNDETDAAAVITEESNSIAPYAIGGILLIVCSIIGFFIARKRRTAKVPTAPRYVTAAPKQPVPSNDSAFPEQTISHAGVSLKDLVLESMREEAARRNSQQR